MNIVQERLFAHRYASTLTDLLRELAADPESLQAMQECYPDLWDDLADNGFACLDLEHYRQSCDIFQFLVEHQPDDPSFHAGLADSQCGLKSYLDAASAYEETIRQAPDIPEAYVYLAEIYMMLAQHEHAKPLLEEAIRLTEEGFEHPMRAAAERLLGFLREVIEFSA
ncbi:MAG: hypothetical protein H6728_03920 [Myxococcales bacterium]|nr:hypothetical protein [Myxococcales bacterium]